MLESGDLLDDRYRLDERIASGGMGDVWRATDVVLGRVVAVKVLRSAFLADPGFAARFQGEARMMAAFRHPGVVEVYDYGETGTRSGEHVAYLVMAHVDGLPLSARLKADGRLDVEETISIVTQVAYALHAAHENGIVHRDVKPGNLLVKPDGTVILVDFGVARSAAVTSITGVNDIVGTALYMAPEQITKGTLSPATDVYALGAVTYHCLAGHPPFPGDNPMEVALRHLDEEPPPLPDDVPAAVQAVVSRAMAKDPADRFPGAEAFAGAAAATIDADPDDGPPPATMFVPAPAHTTVVRPPAGVPPEPAPTRSRPVLGAAVAALVALVLGLGSLAALLAADGGDDGTGRTGGDPLPSSPPPATVSVPAGPVPTVGGTINPTRGSVRPGGGPARTPTASPSATVTPSVRPGTTTTVGPPPTEAGPTTQPPTNPPTNPPAPTTPPVSEPPALELPGLAVR